MKYTYFSVKLLIFFLQFLNVKYLFNVDILNCLRHNIYLLKLLFAKMEPVRDLKNKFIKQIKLKYPGESAPYRFMNPYKLLQKLNEAVKGKYEMQFISVRYMMTKNRFQKQLNEAVYGQIDFKIDRATNNVFSLELDGGQESFLNEVIFNDAILLKPPADYNPEALEKRLQKERQEEENRKLFQYKEAVERIMDVYNGKKKFQPSQVRSIEKLMYEFNKDEYSHGEYEIYVKALMSQPVFERLQRQKNAGKPLEVQRKEGFMKIYFHPTPQLKEPESQLNKEYKISEWALSTKLKEQFYDYFGTLDLNKKAEDINRSVKFKNTISFHENNEIIDGINLTSSLWNQSILRINVRLSQIKLIEIARQVKQKVQKVQYYFYLTYPPKYYISLLKKDEASVESYNKSFERVENFVLLSNNLIKENYMLRFFLFNNTILKITLMDDDSLGYNIKQASEKIERLIKQFKGTIDIKPTKIYEKTFSFKKFTQQFQYDKLLNKMKHANDLEKDKIWQIKYLIMVMVRFNHLIPEEIAWLLNQINQEMQYLDYFLYILWKTATSMWGYSKEQRLITYIKSEFEELKKLQPKDIMKRLSLNTKLIVYIFRVSLTPSGYLFQPPTPEMKGRLLKEYSNQSQFFLRVAIQEQNSTDLKNQKYITKMLFRKEMNQINILDRKYIPLGWSPSQLRSSSLWYLNEIEEDRGNVKRLQRSYILSFLGNFDSIEKPARRAARIGQSFSASWTYDASKIQQSQIPDQYSQNNYLYTDGIGKISEDLLEQISLKLDLRKLSVIQIRYKGAKGVLALSPGLKKYEIRLRPSMIKYKCLDENAKKYLDILDWNKYKGGFLNRQIIILLRTLGIEDSVFIKLQEEHIKEIASMTFKDCSIFQHMTDQMHTEINDLQPANKTILSLLKAGFQLEKQPFFRGVLETMKKNGYHQLKIKSSIRVAKSARIIGIIDEYNVLEENEIYCSVYDPFARASSIDNSKNQLNNPSGYVINGPAIITRNPCLDPADIRVVNCISREQIAKRFKKKDLDETLFEPFVNTVIFPMKGKFPLTAQISGSDLDGDNFFVCWDERLIPKIVSPPNLIDQAGSDQQGKKQQKKYQINYEQMLDFFIDYVNYEKLGQIDNSHLIKADRDLKNYANSKDCKQLARIHGKAVDFPKTGYCPPVPIQLLSSEYPTFMEKQNAKTTYESESVLGNLYRLIKQKIQSLLQDQVYKGVSEIDKDLIIGFQESTHTLNDVKKCVQILQEYERNLTNLISLVHVDSEYEIYSGNFSTSKDKVKAFGKSRLISSILSLRQKFYKGFFQNFEEDDLKYSKATDEKHLKHPNYFGKQVQLKAQLFYLVSYMYKFPDLHLEQPFLEKLKAEVLSTLENLKIINKQGKYCGFIWFIIPKIIINLKITIKDQREKDPEQQIMQQDSQRDYDEGQLD